MISLWTFTVSLGLIISDSVGKQTRPVSTLHPLTPLTPTEIEFVSDYVKSKNSAKQCLFSLITLREPPKRLVAPYLTRLHEASDTPGVITHSIPRKAFVIFIDKVSQRSYELVVDISSVITPTQTYFHNLPPGVKPVLLDYDSDNSLEVVRNSQEVRRRLKELGLRVDQIRVTTWPRGFPLNQLPDLKSKTLRMVFLYFQEFPDDNHYAHPLNFKTIIDTLGKKLIEIQELPICTNFSAITNPGKLNLPHKSANFYPPVLTKDFFRKDSKPLNVESVEGPSYKITDGYNVAWQKFKFRIGFNRRERLVLYDISYQDGNKRRPLFYRMSIADLETAYGDPRMPYKNKQVFDFSDVNSPLNPQKLGQDCLSNAFLIDAVVHDDNGKPLRIPGAICVQEEDGGILHRHSDLGGTIVARANVLVVQASVTFGNYDYVLLWKFHQDASISVEVQATGSLNLNFLHESCTGTPHSTTVSHQIQAQYHQHLLCARIDPMIDGESNSISSVDVVPISTFDDPQADTFDQGFTVRESLLRTELEGISDTSLETDRTWKISNPRSINPVTQKPVAWKLIPRNTILKKALPESWSWKQGRFSTHALWVTKYREKEVNPAGDYPNRPIETAYDDGLWKFVKNNETIKNTDIVLWHSFGFSHLPCVEEFPIMEVVETGFKLKPSGFFTSYPGLDVPATEF